MLEFLDVNLLKDISERLSKIKFQRNVKKLIQNAENVKYIFISYFSYFSYLIYFF